MCLYLRQFQSACVHRISASPYQTNLPLIFMKPSTRVSAVRVVAFMYVYIYTTSKGILLASFRGIKPGSNASGLVALRER
jgi:hypothetical protein